MLSRSRTENLSMIIFHLKDSSFDGNFLMSFFTVHNTNIYHQHEINELSRGFISFQVSFVNREGNEAAHFCAKLSSASSRELIWSGAFPLVLMGITDTHCNPIAGYYIRWFALRKIPLYHLLKRTRM